MKNSTRRTIGIFVLLALPLATSASACLMGEMSVRAAIGVALVDFLTALGTLSQPAPGRRPKELEQ